MGRPERLEAALFDFDGTLADTERYGVELDEAVYRHFGIEPTEEEKHSHSGTDGSETIPALFRAYGIELSAREFFALREGDDVIYTDKPIRLTPGARELMESLVGRGVRVAVVSMTRHDLVETALRRLGIASLVELVVGGDEVAERKPSPVPYLRALELLSVSAPRAVAFEDSSAGVRSAKAAGVYTFGFTGSCTPQDVTAADEVFSSFRDVRL